MKYRVKPCARLKKGGPFYRIFAIHFISDLMWLEKGDGNLLCVNKEDYDIKPVLLRFEN